MGHVARDPQLCCDFRPCPSDDVDNSTSDTPFWDQVFGPRRLASLLGRADKDTTQAL
jgi:hypothetical protein